jgi:hypothetical protein
VAYVRKKKVPNKKTGKMYEYNQLVEGVWQSNGRVKQVVLAHLGEHTTLDAAIHTAQQKVREHFDSAGNRRWTKAWKDLHGRWGEAVVHFPDTPAGWPSVPTPENVMKRAYPRDWEPGSGKGRKWREAFSLSEDPFPTNGSPAAPEDVGEFMVVLGRFWREFDRYSRERERIKNREHLQHVKHYLELREEGEGKGHSREEAHQYAASLAFKATPNRFSQHNPLDAALLDRLDKAFSRKAT